MRSAACPDRRYTHARRRHGVARCGPAAGSSVWPFGSAMAFSRCAKLDALSYCASAPYSTRSRIVLQGGDSASTSSRAMTVRKAVDLIPSDGRYGITSTHQLSSELEHPNTGQFERCCDLCVKKERGDINPPAVHSNPHIFFYCLFGSVGLL